MPLLWRLIDPVPNTAKIRPKLRLWQAYIWRLQGLMPLIGYLGGRSILGFIANWAP